MNEKNVKCVITNLTYFVVLSHNCESPFNFNVLGMPRQNLFYNSEIVHAQQNLNDSTETFEIYFQVVVRHFLK